ncbi:MAG: DoxX family protein [Syntrophomonadaceae bacterium]
MISRLFNRLFKTDENSYSLLFLRVVAAIAILPHGAQKLLGWFGGAGLQATLNGFSAYLGIPPYLAILAVLAESIGAVLLILGLFSRVSALGLAVTMVVAVFTAHIHNGFFMNWGGTAKGEGFEYHFLYLAIVLVIAVKGAGAFALDSILSKRTSERKNNEFELQASN